MKRRTRSLQTPACSLAALIAVIQFAAGQDAVKVLDEMVVTAESEADETVQKAWLPDVAGASIYAGKKTAVLDFDNLPRIVGNNYRQALSQTPGLLLSEESTPLVSIGYRGLNPHRAQFTQVLRDGIPIHADQFGYPEAYYTPPLDTVDRIEFLHGGAALQYGPQPGGALNFITHRPRTDKEFSLRTQHVIGSDDLYSTFTSADGTVDKLGYYTYYNHRQSDGFRSSNSDYELNNGAVKLLYTLENGGKIIFNVDSYEETHGEPGGLTAANFSAGSLAATRLYDEMTIARDSASLTYEIAPDADSFFTANAWWSYYERFSKRQRGGGFGTLPTGASASTNSIELQEFHTLGLDARYRRNWGFSGDTPHTFSTGAQLFHSNSPRRDYRGLSPAAESGVLTNASEREIFYAPVFVENRFRFGSFSITPGVRVENVWQDISETVNRNVNNAGVVTGSNPLESIDDSTTVVLGGIGAEYEVGKESAVYGNISQGYRPRIFSEAVPTGPTAFVNGDLEEGKSVEYELGYRGRPLEWLSFDTSVFLLSFEDQIGTVSVPGGTSLENVGDAIHKGVDASVTVDLLAAATGVKRDDRLDWFFNGTLLGAEFTSGPQDGNTPQYAPDFIVRSGFTWHHGDKGKVSLMGTLVDDHFANDNNTAQYAVPGYFVCDLTAEYKVHKNVRLLAGINNLLDESYYSRVRGDGIDPANGRNYYAGASFEF
jgi:Fe(3+) dicitrate transport protein